jgi:hypothetical protein
MHEPISVSARLPLCSRTHLQDAHAQSLAMTLGSPLMQRLDLVDESRMVHARAPKPRYFSSCRNQTPLRGHW